MSILIRAEMTADTTLETVAADVVALADRMQVPVVVVYGRTDLVAHPGDTVDEVIANYNDSRITQVWLRAQSLARD